MIARIEWDQGLGSMMHTFAYHDPAYPEFDLVVVGAMLGAPYNGNGIDIIYRGEIVSGLTANAHAIFTHSSVEVTYAAWQAATAYAVGEMVSPTSYTGYVYRCTTAGTSGGAEPTWPVTPDDTVADGTVVWTTLAPGSFGMVAFSEARGFYDVTLPAGAVEGLPEGTHYLKRSSAGTDAAADIGHQTGWNTAGLPIPARFTFEISGGGGTVTADLLGGEWISNAIVVPAGETATMTRVQVPWI
jgi:hypothetical protein